MVKSNVALPSAFVSFSCLNPAYGSYKIRLTRTSEMDLPFDITTSSNKLPGQVILEAVEKSILNDGVPGEDLSGMNLPLNATAPNRLKLVMLSYLMLPDPSNTDLPTSSQPLLYFPIFTVVLSLLSLNSDALK